MAAPFYVLAGGAGFWPLHSLTSTCYLLTGGCEVGSPVALICIFLMTDDIKYLFL